VSQWSQSQSLDDGETWERLTGADFRIAYPDHLALSLDERSLFMAGAKNEPGEWRRTHNAETGVRAQPRRRV